LKRAFATTAGVLLLLCLFAGFTAAKSPTLKPVENADFPGEVQSGSAISFSLIYQQEAGDPPRTLKMVVTTPSGDVTIPVAPPGGNPVAGIPVSWTYTPKDTGSYKYHFEATSSTEEFGRYPVNPADDPKFVSFSVATKYIILVVGLVVGLFFLPFVVYVATRSANKHGNPTSAARVALMIGVLASYALFCYLFYTVYGPTMVIACGVAAVALVVVLFTRK
jgi:hypothetical protein